MSKKKTPPEKKQAEYEEDHFNSAWHSPRGFRKTWKKKKNYRNRVVRRKAKSLLHGVEGLSLHELGPDKESLTAELFRKGLSKKKFRKTGVVNLREKIQRKKERLEARKETKQERRDRLAIFYMAGVVALERNPESSEARNLLNHLHMGSASVSLFLRDHPDWKMRLRTRIEQLWKREQMLVEKAKLKAEQKRKWRSPALRLPKTP